MWEGTILQSRIQAEVAGPIKIEFLEGMKVLEALQTLTADTWFTMGKGCTS